MWQRVQLWYKKYRKLPLRLVCYLWVAWWLPKVVVFWLLCGCADFLRNRPLTLQLAYQYFFAGGTITWALAPLNLLVDLLTLKWRCRYQLEDFPLACQEEINALLASVDAASLIQALEQKMAGQERGMIFFKWYGRNRSNELTVPAFHQPFKYIKTIGVSAFNRQCATSRHFGPLRLSLRLLYNIQPIQNEGVYIEVAGHQHHWHDNPLFVFDDTRIHQSFNHADQVRYCLFVDIIRPTPFKPLLDVMLKGVAVLLENKNFIFYKKWGNIGGKK